MLQVFKGEFTEPWAAGEERVNRLIFIGKNLDRAALTQRFESCLALPRILEPSSPAKRAKGSGGTIGGTSM